MAARGRLLLRDWCRALESLVERSGSEPARLETPVSKPHERLRALERELRDRLPDGEPALREALALGLRGLGLGDVSGPLESDAVFDIIVATRRERVGLKVLDTDRSNVLARRLEQLLDEIDAGAVARGVLVRTRPVPESWRRCRELSEELEKRGGAVITFTDDERASLHALGRLEAADQGVIARDLAPLRRLFDRPRTGALS